MTETLYQHLNRLGNADQYFFPQQISHFQDAKNGQKLTFRKGLKYQSDIGGVRINEWDPTGRDPSCEQACQYDFSKMVEAIISLRQVEGFEGCVLSNEYAKTKQIESKSGKRVKFGLLNSSTDLL
jgi:hypothetical protein